MAESAAIAGVKVAVNGRELDDALAARILEVRAEDHLMLPDMFLIRISDPGLEHMDDNPFTIGSRVTVSFGGVDGKALEPVVEGEVTALEPDFGREGATIAARGLDVSHRLNRSPRTMTYQNSSIGDIVKKVAARASVQTDRVDDAGGVQDFVQQTNETDWQFIQRLADRVGNEAVVCGSKLSFRSAGTAVGEAVELTWGQNLLSFTPRVTGVRQVEEVLVRGWDPSAKRAIESTAKGPTPASRNGVKRDDVVRAMSGGQLVVADCAVTTQDEADAMAKGLAQRIADNYVEVSGVTRGDPRLRSGRPIRIAGVGRSFSGDYVVSTAEHVYRGGTGYTTTFRVAGRERRGIAQLVRPERERGRWGADGLAIGIVTQNDDPDHLGRVRVKYPALGDQNEGWWARVISPSAGKERGLLMMPQVDDEVAILFEHGDPRRPFVVGSVWNGKDLPGENLVRTDGSFGLRSDQNVGIRAAKQIDVEGVEAIVLTSGDSKVTLKKDGSVSIEAKSVTVKGSNGLTLESQQSVSIKGSSGVTIDAGGGTVSLKGSQVQLG